MNKVLIAIDGSSASAKVASTGLALAEPGAAIGIVTVVDTRFLAMGGTAAPVEMCALLKEEEKQQQVAVVKQVFKDKNVQTYIREGNPAEEILMLAKSSHADLIVLGTHGRGGLGHLLLGSVAEKLVRQTTIPLLIVPVR